MSRPKPEILIESVDKKTYVSEQILSSQGIWAVYYNGKPINLRNQNLLINYPGPRYKKTAFANPGHAINLAKKLNLQHKTSKFTVVLLDQGEQIFPPLQNNQPT